MRFGGGGVIRALVSGFDWSTIDGSPNAPVGPPQFSSLLNSYHPGGQADGRNRLNGLQPPYSVAGVDYAVGIPAGTVLQDPNGLVIPGVTVNKRVSNGGSTSDAIGNFLAVTGNNVTIDAFDFALHGGWQVDVIGNNCSILRSKFLAQTTAQTPIFFETTAVGGTVKYCEIDGNNGASPIAAAAALLWIIGGGGQFTVQYCYIHDVFSDCVDPGGNTQPIGFDCRFNLLVNAGISISGHGDFIQSQSAAGGTPFSSWVTNFNTLYQPTAPAGGGTQGITIFQHTPGFPSFVNPDCSYNTIIALFPGTMPAANEDVNPFISMEQTCIIGNGTCDYNFSDTSGNLTTNNNPGLFLVTDVGGGGQSGTVSVGPHNVSMIGKALSNLGGGSYRYV